MANQQVKIKRRIILVQGGVKRHPVTGRATSSLQRRDR
jgi:hypothetical protein